MPRAEAAGRVVGPGAGCGCNLAIVSELAEPAVFAEQPARNRVCRRQRERQPWHVDRPDVAVQILVGQACTARLWVHGARQRW